MHPTRAPIVRAHPRPLRQHDALHQDRHADLRRLRRIEAAEFGGRHADDVHRVVVDEDFLPYDIRIAREAAHPVVVTEHDNGMAAVDAVIFFGGKHASDRRFHAEHREVVARHQFGIDPLGLVVDADRRRREATADHFAERFGALLQVLVDGVRMHPRAHVAAVVRTLLIKHHQPIRVFDRQLAQQDLIHQRENRRVRANPKRERQRRDDGKEWIAAQPADGQAQVCRRSSHGCFDVGGRQTVVAGAADLFAGRPSGRHRANRGESDGLFRFRACLAERDDLIGL